MSGMITFVLIFITSMVVLAFLYSSLHQVMPAILQGIAKAIMSLIIIIIVVIFLYFTLYHGIIDFLSDENIKFIAQKIPKRSLEKGAGIGLGMTAAAHIIVMFILYVVMNIVICIMVQFAPPQKLLSWPAFITATLLFLLYARMNIPGEGFTSLGQTDVLIRILVLVLSGPLHYFLAWGTRKFVEIPYKQA